MSDDEQFLQDQAASMALVPAAHALEFVRAIYHRGLERGRTNLTIQVSAKQIDTDFEAFWVAWRPFDIDKGSKQKAKENYRKARKETDNDTNCRRRSAL